MSVALINMPFGSLSRPALGISILKSVLKTKNISCKNYYLNLDFVKFIGDDTYRIFTTETKESDILVSHKFLTGEWLFSNYFYDTAESEKSDYLEYLLKQYPKRKHKTLIETLNKVSNIIPEYIEHCLKIDWGQYKVVGFTSMFEQTYASLVLARAIKNKYPNVKIGFGGANCESTLGLGLINMFPFIDFVSMGEADNSFPELAQSIINGDNTWINIKGFATRNGVIRDNGFSDEVNLELIPSPCFDDYFIEFNKLKNNSLSQVYLLMETSRGCWWGQKNHCTFCALNGDNINFRSKSLEKSISEIEFLTQKYKVNYVEFTDNVLGVKLQNRLLDYLISKGSPYHIFMELKSNLNRVQVKKLMRARVQSFQAGIESLSDKTLKIMNKGTNGLSNIALLKYCKIYNIRVSWNFIYGFPGEDIDEFDWFLNTFKNIVHFTPPISVTPIRLDKFSPNYIESDRVGLINKKPLESYYHVFRENEEVINNIAFYYDFDYHDGRKPLKYAENLTKFWRNWQKCSNVGSLYLVESSKHEFLICDSRYTKKAKELLLNEIQASIYAMCDSPQKINNLALVVEKEFGMSKQELKKHLNLYIENDVMLESDNKYLSLALISDNLLFNLKIKSNE